jgi:hypothetical protein
MGSRGPQDQGGYGGYAPPSGGPPPGNYEPT